MTDPVTPENSRRRWLMIGGAAVVIIAIAGGLFWFLGRDVPEEASLEGALEAVADDTAPPSTNPPDTTAAPDSTAAPEDDATTTTTTSDVGATGVDGTWTVDTSIGEFSFEEATSSFVGFRIKEVLGTIGETEAVGRTPEVTGMLEIEGSTITDVQVEANMDAIITNDSRRDSRAKGSLNTGQFPTATFVLTEPIDLGAVPVDGEPITATAVGDLTVSGVTQPVEFDIEAQLEGDLIVVVGSTNVTFSDFGVEVPSAPIVVSVEDNGIVEVQLWFSQ